MCVNKQISLWDVPQAHGSIPCPGSGGILCTRGSFVPSKGWAGLAGPWLSGLIPGTFLCHPTSFIFLFSPTFWACLPQCGCAGMDEGESRQGGGAGRGEQDKADGCSANGASPFIPQGEGPFIVTIAQSSLIFHSSRICLLLNHCCAFIIRCWTFHWAAHFTSFLILARLGFQHRTSSIPLCIENTPWILNKPSPVILFYCLKSSKIKSKTNMIYIPVLA